MTMDIQFAHNGIRFNVRASCIIKNSRGTHILLTRMRGITDHEAYLLPGGRAELLEATPDAVVRELREELGLTLDCRLVAIEENIAPEIDFHMLEFVYEAVTDVPFARPLPDNGWDQFRAAAIAELDAIDLRPPAVKALILRPNRAGIVHHVNHDWF